MSESGSRISLTFHELQGLTRQTLPSSESSQLWDTYVKNPFLLCLSRTLVLALEGHYHKTVMIPWARIRKRSS
ncbi:uncharacterized protein G2W53_026571 [Senna tora]|uniref:Uncharacterized protein n=1 Tax=Senna tora TaxID=362788 RepID=A0A834TH86_9FABA|nr:uncharacterized protein G2W53_026571 [Senna tora]